MTINHIEILVNKGNNGAKFLTFTTLLYTWLALNENTIDSYIMEPIR